jgi:hypothetical protein
LHLKTRSGPISGREHLVRRDRESAAAQGEVGLVADPEVKLQDFGTALAHDIYASRTIASLSGNSPWKKFVGRSQTIGTFPIRNKPRTSHQTKYRRVSRTHHLHLPIPSSKRGTSSSPLDLFLQEHSTKPQGMQHYDSEYKEKARCINRSGDNYTY